MVVVGWVVPKSKTCLACMPVSLPACVRSCPGGPRGGLPGTLSLEWAMRFLSASRAMWKCLSWGYPCAWCCCWVLSSLNLRLRRLVHLGRSACVQSCCAWLPGKQSRTVKRSPATKLHHQNSPALTCRLKLRAAVSCCLGSRVPLLDKGESKVAWRLLGPAA